MTKRGQLSKKQLSVLADLFSGQGDEQAILDKHKISRDTYKKWLTNDNFIEEFNIRVTLAYHQSRALIASYSSLAAVKLVQLTESGKEETARKACLDIISLSAPLSRPPKPLHCRPTPTHTEGHRRTPAPHCVHEAPTVSDEG